MRPGVPPGGPHVHAGLPPDHERRRSGEPAPRSGRETVLGFVLVAVLGGTIIFFLNFVSFGIFSYVLCAALAVTAVGFLHYLLWGYALSQELAEEMHRARLERERQLDEGR